MASRVRFLAEKCAEVPDQPYQPTDFDFRGDHSEKTSKLIPLYRALGLDSSSGYSNYPPRVLTYCINFVNAVKDECGLLGRI